MNRLALSLTVNFGLVAILLAVRTDSAYAFFAAWLSAIAAIFVPSEARDK